MFKRQSLIAVARAAARNLDSSAFVATDLSEPFSNAAIRSDSSGSVFGILLTLASVVSCCLSAGDEVYARCRS
jgi:hypothetical protein